MNQTVTNTSLVTLHYRISLPNGQPLISTFESTPTTLQLGQNEMLPAIEQLIVGLKPEETQHFELKAEEAFGPYRPELVEKVKRIHMPEDITEPMTLMEFNAPDGSTYTGLVRELDDESALVDFNHPLAGKAIHFEVKIIGIL